MGCYGDEVIVAKLPAVLPKLCAQIRAITGQENPFKSLSLRAYLNDELIAELALPEDQLENAGKQALSRENAPSQSVLAIMAFSPLVVPEPSRLRIEVESESGILNGGFISIRERTASDPQL